jgi:hypothetical protein
MGSENNKFTDLKSLLWEKGSNRGDIGIESKLSRTNI